MCVSVCVWGGGGHLEERGGVHFCVGGGGRCCWRGEEGGGGWVGRKMKGGGVSGAELPTSTPPPLSSPPLSSSPPSRSVCEPLAVTCSTRTDVSACWRAHATFGEEPEPEVRHRSVFSPFQNLTHLPAREQLDQVVLTKPLTRTEPQGGSERPARMHLLSASCVCALLITAALLHRGKPLSH